MARIIVGNEVPSTLAPRSLVFMATHDRGGNSLPYRYRSFISFSFGYKDPENREDPVKIEDFNLIATVNGDRMLRNLTGNFEDLTSTYDVIDGLFYHSTHFLSNSLSFTLSTDGIDSRMLEKFTHWFAPGQTRELVLSEHPNRAIMARVALPPEIDMLPFEKQIQMTVGGIEYTTSVTNFKGDILLEFVMDDPFWYSIINIFGKIITVNNQISYVNEWDGVAFLENSDIAKDKLKDVLKIVYEDGVPIYSMIASPMIFGNDVYAVAGGRLISFTVTPIDETTYNNNSTKEGYYNNGLKDNNDDKIYYSTKDPSTGNTVYHLYYMGGVVGTAVIEGAYVTNTSNTVLTLDAGRANALKLYYAGTAPSPVDLEFTIPITLNDSKYVKSIASSIITVDQKPYSTFTFECIHKNTICFTTPNMLTSYNKAVLYLRGILNANKTGEEIRILMRDEIRHPFIRELIINIINALDNTNSVTFNSTKITTAINNLSAVLPTSLSVTINSKTGATVGVYHFSNSTTIEENIGDMLSSNYLILTDRNTFDDNMLLQGRTEDHLDYSYIVYHDFPVRLSNISIKYLNLYY